MLSVADFEKSILALMMWAPENQDGLQGMTVIGLVLANRVKAGWGNWLTVSEPSLAHWPDTRDPKFRACLAKADSIYEGTEEDITGGALYYVDLATPPGGWFLDNIVRKPEAHPRVGTVGRFTLFR